MTPTTSGLIVLAIASAAWMAWIAVVLLRKPFSPTQNLVQFLNRLVTSLLWRIQSPTRVPLPPGRGGVIVSNHRSSIDPCFIQRSTMRKVHWLVAKEYVEHSALRWFLKTCEVIPVNRGGIDTAATRLAMRYVQAGELIGMFPEGRINTTDQLFISVRPGAALVAIKTRAMVLPCYLTGSPYGGTALSPLFMPSRVTVQYGPPIDAADYADRIQRGENEAAVTKELLRETMKALARLAGQDDFEPELAGRNWKPQKNTPPATTDGVGDD